MGGAVTEFPRVEFFQDTAGEFRWRLKARNGKIVATCGEGYTRKAECKASYVRIFKLVTETTVEVVHDASWG